MFTLPPALAPFGNYCQFIIYYLTPSKARPGKMDKIPCNPATGRAHDAHDRAAWTDWRTAAAAAERFGAAYGVGFVFADTDPFWFFDLDGCLQSDGTWSPLAQHMISAFPYAAVEVSQSGRGLHIFGTGALPPHGCKNEALGLELYHTLRFCALTGNARGDAGADCTYALPWLVENYFPLGAGAGNTSAGVSGDWRAQWDALCAVGPHPDWHGPGPDADGLLIERALKSRSAKSAFGGTGASFADLWTADEAALERAYPDHGGQRAWDRSSADRALAGHLAFWTGRDHARIESLMRRSELVREKWDRDDYLPRTIMAACADNRDMLQDSRPPALPPPPTPGEPAAAAAAPTGDAVAAYRAGDIAPASVTAARGGIMYSDHQAVHFAGCVYVTEQHRVMVPGGQLLKPEQFKVVYGGHEFIKNSESGKMAKDAWDAFTASTERRAPAVDNVCFLPAVAPGAIVEIEGRRKVNTFWPVEVRRTPGDVGPFLRHLEKLIPNDEDRETALSYMCACVQLKGVKFKWAPLFQGVEGNGKSLLSQCVAYSIGRRHCHWPRADQITEKFNSWLFDKIFIGVEDVYVPEHKGQTLEILKPMITGENLAKRSMQTDQVDSEVICNFILNCNARDGLRKSRNDRRLAIFYTAQQSEADLARDGMTREYFQGLWEWLKRDGFAIVAELLSTRPISAEFQTTLMTRAPITSSTEAAIAYGLGSIEQEVLEAVDQGLPGFAGGWISSAMFDMLLDRIGKTGRVPVAKRRELLQSLGYDWHPGLEGGRVHNQVEPDNAKPRLYVKKGHPAIAIESPAAIAKAYTAAQKAGTSYAPPTPPAAAVFKPA